MGNYCSKVDNRTDAVGIAGVAVGGVVFLFVAAEYGINYYGDALYYGVLTGFAASAVTFAAQNHFNIGQMTGGGIRDSFVGLICAFMPY